MCAVSIHEQKDWIVVMSGSILYKRFCKLSLNITELLHPVSDTVPLTPGVPSFRNLLIPLFLLNTKYGGIHVPDVLPLPIMVVVSDFPVVTDCTLISVGGTIEGGV